MARKKMMRYLLALTSSIFFSSVVFAADMGAVYNGFDDYTIPAYKIGKVKKITVTVESKKDDSLASGKGEGDCQHWKITQKQAKFFFKHAKKISMGTALHNNDYSSCSAEGTVELSNGDKGEWTISPGGSGTLIVNIGKPNGDYINLYCKKCDDQGMGRVATLQ